MPTKTVDAPTRPADLHPAKPTSGPAHDARRAQAKASAESVKIRDEFTALKAESNMLTAEIVEAFTAGKSVAKLLTRSSDIDARTQVIAVQQVAISAATVRLMRIAAAAEQTDKQMIAWREQCSTINAAWQRLEREAHEMYPPSAVSAISPKTKVKAEASRDRVNEERRAFLEAERLHLADRYS